MDNETKQVNTKIRTYLSFRLDNEVFASDVSKVLNILELSPITKVPKSPEYMRGVINLRGSVLPVVDLRVKFGMSPTVETVDTCIIVLNINVDDDDITLGILVDAVSEVLEIEDKEIEASPSIGTKYKTEFIQGMWKKEEGFIMILDINRVFSTDEIIQVKEVENTEAEIKQEKKGKKK